MPEREDKASDDHVFRLAVRQHQSVCLKPWAESGRNHQAFYFSHQPAHVRDHDADARSGLYTVSKLLGHADVRMTQVYAKIINQKKDEAVNLVNGLFD